ncbi:MAG: DUF350 domain-containing protein [Candidatus Marinimicrobia bacterium]|nr:DUF350 domain-containing protein [Candidatus Neomarinimicrobiota bacterium]
MYSLGDTVVYFIRIAGWAVAISIGFSIAIAIAIWIFSLLSRDIDEWSEIRDRNYGVAAIVIALMTMIALIMVRVF